MSHIDFNDVRKVYGSGAGEVRVLDRIDMVGALKSTE